MSNIAQLRKANALSGLIFGLFVLLHLICHYSLNFSVETANANLLKARLFYRHPVVEILLFASLFVHVGTNTSLYIARNRIKSTGASKKSASDGTKKKEIPGALELKAHRIAGYFLAFSVFGHAAATRVLPYFFLADPNSYDYGFITHACNLFGVGFAAYLALLGMAGGWHLIHGTRSALATLSGSSAVGKPFPVVLKVLAFCNTIAIIAAVVIVARSGPEIHKEADEFYKTVGNILRGKGDVE